MSTDAARRPAGQKEQGRAGIVKGAVAAALVGWVVVYNLVRIITGSEPDATLLPTAPVGVAGGVVVYLLVVRPLVQRYLRRTVVPADAMDAAQADAVRMAGWALAGLALIALVMGALLAVDFLTAPSGDRPLTSLVLAGWNIVGGLWCADEVARIRALDLDGLDFGVAITSVTAVMAALGFARDTIPAGQIVLIAASAVAGGAVGLAVWRLNPDRRAPVLAPLAVLVAAGSLAVAVLG